MLIGYSFWGFLGPGVVDTPDGGRSHRRTLVDGLRDRGHQIVFLQPDRDRAEAGTRLSPGYRWDAGLPDVDVLFLEWRWPIAGRNTTRCGSPGHTCDLHRQADLVAHYTDRLAIPTILWDKDRTLPADDPLRDRVNVTVCEPALNPSPGAVPLLFPVSDTALDAADPDVLAARPRPVPLIYVGNQYDRDDAFDSLFAPAAARIPHIVAGKWPDASRWPYVTFTGRVPFRRVADLYGNALVTVLLLPERYRIAGQMTQRIFEALLAGCLPLTPATIRGAEVFTPRRLHVTDAGDVLSRIGELGAIAGTSEHADLLAACLHKLDLFRLSAQVDTLDRVLSASMPVGR